MATVRSFLWSELEGPMAERAHVGGLAEPAHDESVVDRCALAQGAARKSRPGRRTAYPTVLADRNAMASGRRTRCVSEVKLTAMTCGHVAAIGPLRTSNHFWVACTGLSEPRAPGNRLRSCPPGLASPAPPPLLRCAGHPPPSAWNRLGFAALRTAAMLPRALWWGAVRSEVKEEGRAQPDPGDMNAAQCPAAVLALRRSHGRRSRTTANGRQPTPPQDSTR